MLSGSHALTGSLTFVSQKQAALSTNNRMETSLPFLPQERASLEDRTPEIEFSNALIEYAIRQLLIVSRHTPSEQLDAIIQALEKAKLEPR